MELPWYQKNLNQKHSRKDFLKILEIALQCLKHKEKWWKELVGPGAMKLVIGCRIVISTFLSDKPFQPIWMPSSCNFLYFLHSIFYTLLILFSILSSFFCFCQTELWKVEVLAWGIGRKRDKEKERDTEREEWKEKWTFSQIHLVEPEWGFEPQRKWILNLRRNTIFMIHPWHSFCIIIRHILKQIERTVSESWKTISTTNVTISLNSLNSVG